MSSSTNEMRSLKKIVLEKVYKNLKLKQNLQNILKGTDVLQGGAPLSARYRTPQ
jgi:hypothetical protein